MLPLSLNQKSKSEPASRSLFSLRDYSEIQMRHILARIGRIGSITWMLNLFYRLRCCIGNSSARRRAYWRLHLQRLAETAGPTIMTSAFEKRSSAVSLARPSVQSHTDRCIFRPLNWGLKSTSDCRVSVRSRFEILSTVTNGFPCYLLKEPPALSYWAE